MSDKLVVEIDSKDAEVAMRNLDRLTTAAEQMGKAFENTKGATSALRELRLMLTGIKGQGSSLDELKNSIQSLNSTADSLKRSFAGSVGQLGRIFKNEMAELKSIVQETGLGVGRAAAKGIEDGMAEAPAAIRKQGRTIAAAAKAEATRIYEAMVAGQANAKIKDVGALFKLDEAGATLSPYHKQVLENWKKSSAETFRAMKAQLATEREQLEGQVKAENEALQSALKRMEGESKTRNASLTSIYRSSLARGNSSISQVRTALKAEAAQLQATVKSENDALQTALQSMESNSRDKAKSLAAIYRDSLGRGNFAMAQVKSKLKAESSELQAAVKAEESELQRALQAMEASDKLRKSSLAEIYAGSLKRGDQGIARVKAQLREQADNIIQANKTELARVQAQVAAATNNAGGLYQKYSPQSGMAGPVVDPAKIGQVNQLSKAFKQLTIDGNDAHSMARGLASGFNLLWLTWGNLAPLFAGASISFGIKKTFDIGSEVEYQIKMMETLGQTTQTQGRVIRQALRDIDQTTQFSLVELSQAMVRLGQAGKTPAEALEILRPAADLASVGMVDLKTSTDLLIQTQALFGKSTADVGKIAAQVFEITKSGVLNVEDIGDSMKYASEANTRFGKSVEETLAILGALAQAGIKGSSAGTAYINFLRDLNGRSGPAISAMKELEKATGKTIKVFDEAGKQRSAIDIFEDIAAAADKLKAKDADKILAKIFSDRGGRAFFAMIRDGNIKLRETVDILEKSDPNKLFMAAKGLMDTTKGALNILQGAMVGALDKVFEANETQFKTFITDITAAVSSPEFAMAMHGMVGAVSGLYESIKTLMPVLTTLGTAWAVFKAASIGVSIFQGLAVAIAGMAPVLGMTIKSIAQTTGALITSTAAWSANGVAMIGNVAASRAAAAGMDAVGVAAARTAATTAVAGVGMRGLSVVLGFLANPIVGIIATLGLLGAAFWSAKSDAEGATAGIAAAVISNGKINIGQWNEEIRKLRERNSLMGQSDAYTPLEAGINEARTKLAKESAEYMTILEKYENESKGASARQQEVLDARYGRVLESKMKSIRKEQEAINQARDAIDSARMKDLSAREEAERQQRAKQQAGAKGQGDIEIPGGGGKGFGRPEFVPFDNQIQQIEKQYAINLKADATQAANQQKILAAKHSAMLISEGQYQAELFKITTLSETKQLQVIDDASAKFEKAYKERAAVLQAAKKTDDLKNLEATKKTFTEKVGADKDAIADKRATDIEVAAIKATEAVNKLAVANTEYWAKIGDNKQALTAISDIEAKYAQVTATSSVTLQATKAGELAAVAATQQHAEKLRAVQNEATKSVQLYAALVQAKEDYAATPDANPVNLALFDTAIAQVKATTTTVISELNKTATEVGQSSSEAFALAFKGTAQQIFDSLSSLDFAAGFDDATNALSGLLQGMDKLILAQEAYKLSREAAVKLGKEGESEVARLDAQNAKNQIRNYGQMAESAKGFFKEGSRGYKAMDKVSKAFRAAELAGAVFNTGKKLALMATEVASAGVAEANKTAISNTGEAARMPAKIAGIFASFMSMMGPWGIPAAIAAIAAVGLSAYGKSNSNTLAPTNEGKGTVFGDKEAKSESVGKTIQLLEGISKFAGIENSYAAKMLTSLRSIENSMGGVTNLVLRSNGAENAAAKVQQGYSDNGVTKAISGAGTVMTVAGLVTGALGPLGFVTNMLLGKLLAPIITKLFGTKTKVTGQGLYAADTTLDQVMAGGLEAGYYVDINKKKKAFGITYSNKNSTNFTKDDEISRQFSLILNGFVDSVKLAAPVLGFSLDQIDTNLKDFVVKIGRVDLKDLSGEEIQEKLAAVFGAVGDDIAKAAIPGLEKFQNVGEGYFETLARVASNLSSVNQMFDTLGVKLFDASIAGAEASIKFAEFFGGLENMASVVGDYYETFYTEEERIGKLQEQLTREFAALGKEMPASNAAFREMVEGLLNNASADTGEGSMELAAKLLQLAPAFAQVSDYANTLSETMKRLQSDTANLQIELLRAQGNTAGADAAQRTLDTAGFNDAEIAIYDYNNSLRLQIQSISDAAEAIKGLKAETQSLEVQLLRAQGNTLGADSAQRAIDIAGYDAAAIAIYDYNAAIRKQIEELEKAKGASQAAIDNLGRLASRVSTTFNSLESAGTLLDKIGSALGLGAGTYAAEKEKALWAALSVSNGEKQVEIAGKLTEIVLARQQLEIQNAEKLLDFSKNLKSYVDSLKLGATSPLTNAQKLAEASRQYTGTLSKAKSGDVDAQAKIQSISSEYLGLAQAYYAGNETYENIFNSVVSELDALGLSSMSESQQQLAVGNKSLAELQKLYAITESTYSSLSNQYENQLKELSTARDDLLLQENSLSELKSISTVLSGLPAEIAARIGKSGNYFSDNPDVAAAYQQNSYGLSAEDFAYTHYMKYGKYEQRNLPSFATGIANVPYDMTANIHSGERVMTAKDNSIFSGIDFSGQGTRELVEEVRNLREEVRMLRNENREDAQMQARATSVSSESAANKIAESNSKVVYNATVKQGAKIV